MNQREAEELLNLAIDTLVESDRELLALDVTERALSHQLAHYISVSGRVARPLVVDCEYNRHFDNPKRLNLPPRKALDREVRATTVFPDILIHQRNTDENNILVVELKKPGEDLEYDELKLNAFRRELGYRHAAHVILGLNGQGILVREIQWVDG